MDQLLAPQQAHTHSAQDIIDRSIVSSSIAAVLWLAMLVAGAMAAGSWPGTAPSLSPAGTEADKLSADISALAKEAAAVSTAMSCCGAAGGLTASLELWCSPPLSC